MTLSAPAAEYQAEIEKWRDDMEARLRGPYSWPSLAGLYWLEEGDNPFGSAPENPIRLPERAPAFAGIFEKQGPQVVLELAEGISAKLNDESDFPPVTALHDDHSEHPDYLFIDDIRMLIIKRGDRQAVRIWDPNAVSRLNFKGRIWWPVDASARVEARIERYDPPKQVLVDDVVGIQQTGLMDAKLHFTWRGHPCSLEGELLDDGSYDILLKDATAGKGSYPGGRFLVSEIADGEHVILDFNKAYNTPCAFTDLATCPLPQPGNVLRLAIEAGEKYEASGNSHH